MIKILCLFLLGYALYEGISFFQLHSDDCYQLSKTYAQALFDRDEITLQSMHVSSTTDVKDHFEAAYPDVIIDGQRRWLYHRLLAQKFLKADEVLMHVEQVVRYDSPGEHTLLGTNVIRIVYKMIFVRNKGEWCINYAEVL